MVTTFLVLFLVPAMIGIQADFGALRRRTPEAEHWTLPAFERYSFVFDGSAQVLDHALTSAALSPLVQGFEYGRGNADAAAARDGDPGPLRSSDHDGLVLFLFVDADGDGVTDAADLCADTAIPEGVPTVRLGVNRFALVDGDGTFDTTPPPGGGQGPGLSFTIEDTAGCSCEQIIGLLGLGAGHAKLGCSVEVMVDFAAAVPRLRSRAKGTCFRTGSIAAVAHRP